MGTSLKYKGRKMERKINTNSSFSSKGEEDEEDRKNSQKKI